MSKLIKFIPSPDKDEDLRYIEEPKPAIEFIPKWWKDQKLTISGDSNIFNNLSFKACVPFLDSLTSGYMIYTGQDIGVTIDNGIPGFSWRLSPDPIIYRASYQNLPVPPGHFEHHFVWAFPFGIQLPKGYSMLITHPLNRFDLPFTSVSGIVDEGVPWGGRFTFWLKETENTIIPKGTPIAQIIPFKTESWKSTRDDSLVQYSKDERHKRDSVLSGYYKKVFYRKKRFE